MSKVILLCGKICAGKTTYAKQLIQQHPAVYLDADGLMTRFFPEPLGDQYDVTAGRAYAYLRERAADIVRAGADVILDGAGWLRSGRRETTAYFQENGIPCEWHFIDVSEKRRRKLIEKRNDDVLHGKSNAYFADGGLLSKCLEQFEPPEPSEIAVRVLDGVIQTGSVQ